MNSINSMAIGGSIEGTLAQINQLRASYEQQMAAYQQQLNVARQNIASMVSNPFNNQQAATQQAQIPFAQPAQQPVAGPSVAHETPYNVQFLTALGDIRAAIEKNSELLAAFTSQKLEKPKLKGDESDKK